jgi:hypothetical protein
MEQARKNTAERTVELAALAGTFRDLRLKETEADGTGPWNTMDAELREIAVKLEASAFELDRAGAQLAIASSMADPRLGSRLVLLKRGSMDLTTRPWMTIVLSVVGAVLAGALAACVFFVAWWQAGPDVIRFMTEASVEHRAA